MAARRLETDSVSTVSTTSSETDLEDKTLTPCSMTYGTLQQIQERVDHCTRTDAFEFGNFLKDWTAPKERMPEASLPKHDNKILRYALFGDSGGGAPKLGLLDVSRCRGCQEESHCWHCPVCKECNDWHEWHCGEYNECTYGSSISCDGCGGVTESYREMRT